jgi:hypothetical protein
LKSEAVGALERPRFGSFREKARPRPERALKRLFAGLQGGRAPFFSLFHAPIATSVLKTASAYKKRDKSAILAPFFARN